MLPRRPAIIIGATGGACHPTIARATRARMPERAPSDDARCETGCPAQATPARLPVSHTKPHATPPNSPGSDPTEGMITIRHVAGTTRSAYNRIYAGDGIRHADRFSDWVLSLVEARPGQRLLDVACGEAQLLRRAAQRGLEVHGVDLSDVALREGLAGEATKGATRPGLTVANGERLPYPDDHFDLVTNMGSLEHYEDPVRGAVEMARVLAPDGLVALHVPNTFGLRWAVLHAWRHGEVHDDGQPLQRYGTRDQWTRLLAAGGLRVERVLGYEDLSHWPGGARGLAVALRHPTRLLVPLARWLPVDMASMLLFLCRKADGPDVEATR